MTGVDLGKELEALARARVRGKRDGVMLRIDGAEYGAVDVDERVPARGQPQNESFSGGGMRHGNDCAKPAVLPFRAPGRPCRHREEPAFGGLLRGEGIARGEPLEIHRAERPVDLRAKRPAPVVDAPPPFDAQGHALL